MSRMSRRRFLDELRLPLPARASPSVNAIVGAGCSAPTTRSESRSPGSTDVAATTSRSSRLEGVEIVYLIDPDTRTYAKEHQRIESKGGRAQRTVQDARRASRRSGPRCAHDQSTPNHWHALMTIWGCQAGRMSTSRSLAATRREGRSIVERHGSTTGLSSTARKAAPANRGINLPTRSARANSAKSSSRADSVTSRAEASDSSPNTTPPSEGRLHLWLARRQRPSTPIRPLQLHVLGFR